MAMLRLCLLFSILCSGCANSSGKCWADQNKVAYCTSFVQQHFWTGAVAMTSYNKPPDVAVSDQLATSTGIASTLGGSVLGEVAQHVVVAP